MLWETAAGWVLERSGLMDFGAGLALIHGMYGWVLLHLRYLCAYTQ